MRPVKSVPNSKKNNQKQNKKTDNEYKKNIINVAALFGTEINKMKSISFRVLIRCSNEYFNVINFPITMKIRDLKGLLEFVCGIPYNLQRLSYLDDGELIDPKEIQYYDIIDGAVVFMDVWTIYLSLVKSVLLGNLEDVLKQGVSKNIQWNSPTSDYMFLKDRLNYLDERSGIALFIASHRGNIELIKGLIAHDANLKYRSSYGRTPIMIAVVAEKMHVIEYLLEQNSVEIDSCDVNGDSPLTLAKKFNFKLGQHKLAQYKWKKRTEEELKSKLKAKSTGEESIFSETRLPHQINDSAKKTWLKGNFMQVYMAQLVPDPEFSGGSLSAPKSVGAEVIKQHKLARSSTDLSKSLKEQNESLENIPQQSGLSFDKWLNKKVRAKRIQEELKKSNEMPQLPTDPQDLIKEVSFAADGDKMKDIWMKDFSNKQNSRNELSKKSNSSSIGLKSNDDINIRNLTSSSKSKIIEINNIYNGMPYDEWAKIRDKFLKTHNMLK